MKTPSLKPVQKIKYSGQNKELQSDTVLVEQPLQIDIIFPSAAEGNDYSPYLITMRTPDHEQELIIGLLIAQGIIKLSSDIIEILPSEVGENHYKNQWQIHLKQHCLSRLYGRKRVLESYSSCGLCGTDSIKALEVNGPPTLSKVENWLDKSVILNVVAKMKKQQLLFQQTGGAHGAALFNDEGAILQVREDIGRHNALDKVLGWRFTNNYFESKCDIAAISSRISFEMVQKVIMSGVCVLIAIGAPSDLAIKTAQRFDLTLIAFVKGDSFNVYHGEWRLRP